MSEKKEYKPIMVVYFIVQSNEHYSAIQEVFNPFKESGFDVLFFGVTEEKNARVEIISVDKATVVEDIQKYIDEKLLIRELEQGMNTESVPREEIMNILNQKTND